MRKRLVASALISTVVVALLAIWAAGAFSASVRHPGKSEVTGHRRDGTVKGAAELCVPKDPTAGSSGASCAVFAGKWSGCDGHVCRTLDRAVVKTSAAKTVASVPLQRGRFTVRVPPGEYKLELLFTAKHKQPVVAQPTLRARVRADHTTRVVFKGYAG
jgi:hypothetical protein